METATPLITSPQLYSALVQAGIIRGDEAIRRIVIDAQVNQAVRIYVERFADRRLLDVMLTLDGVKVITEDA